MAAGNREFCLEPLRALWRAVRAVTGDDAYERYLRQHGQCARHECQAPMDRRAFHAAEVDRRWSGIRRCC